MTKSPAEIAAEEWADKDIPKHHVSTNEYAIDCFLAGAQWQKEQDEKEVCGDCDGSGSTNPPYWTVRCRNCGGSGVK